MRMNLEYAMSLPDIPEKIKTYKIFASKLEMLEHVSYKDLNWKPASEISENIVSLEFYSKKKAVAFYDLFLENKLIAMTNFII